MLARSIHRTSRSSSSTKRIALRRLYVFAFSEATRKEILILCLGPQRQKIYGPTRLTIYRSLGLEFSSSVNLLRDPSLDNCSGMSRCFSSVYDRRIFDLNNAIQPLWCRSDQGRTTIDGRSSSRMARTRCGWYQPMVP